MNALRAQECASFDPWLLPYGPDTVNALRLAHRLGPMFAVRQWQLVKPELIGQVWDKETLCDWEVLLPDPMNGLATVCFSRKVWCWGGSRHARSMTGYDRMKGAGARWVELIADSIREATRQALQQDIVSYQDLPQWEGWVQTAQRSLLALDDNIQSTNFCWKGDTDSRMLDADLGVPVQLVTDRGTFGSVIVTDDTCTEQHGSDNQKVTYGIYQGCVVYERQHMVSGTGCARRWAREAVQRAALRWREMPYGRTDHVPSPGPQPVPQAPRSEP